MSEREGGWRRTLNSGGGPAPTVPVVCACATTADCDLSGSETTITDGVASGTNLVLVWQQATASQNGVYKASTSGAWTRYPTAPFVFVTAGTLYANRMFTLIAPNTYVAAAGGAAPTVLTVCNLASTVNITSLSGSVNVDGTASGTLAILVKNQDTASQNGVYTAAAGAWTKTDSPSPVIKVLSGTTQAGLLFTLDSANTYTACGALWK